MSADSDGQTGFNFGQMVETIKQAVKAPKAARLFLTGSALALSLAGCAVGPDYVRPAAPAPTNDVYNADINDTNSTWKLAEPQAQVAKGSWWEIFGDTNLNQLEVAAGLSNQTLKSSVALYTQARAIVDVNRSGYFPHLNAIPSYTRERDSANRPINGFSSGIPATYNTFTVPLDANYELDLWGRIRRIVESARSNADAIADDVENVRLSIQAELATDFFMLHALDAEIALLHSSVEVFQKSLDLTLNRRAGGIATDLDVAQAETVLKTTEALIPTTYLQRRRVEHALAVLTGQPASNFSLKERTLNLAPPILPPGVPSELLERRPDIAAAERRVASANANIGIAKGAFYPRVFLSGAAGFESVGTSTLFDWPSRFWSFGPSINFPIFEGGILKAQYKQTKAAYDQIVAQYRENVLESFAEVEDNLAAQKLLVAEYDALDAAIKAAQKNLDIANNRYKAGLVTYLDVATAQNSSLDLERQAVRLRGDQLVTTVALIKSLGGGWQAASPPAKTP